MGRNEDGNLAFVMSETNLGQVMRKARGTISLREMARESGIDVPTLSRIETGKIEVPRRDTLARISRAYGIPLETLAQLVYLGQPAAISA